MAKLILLLILTLFIMLSGCGGDNVAVPPHEPLTLQDVLSIARERREGIEKPTVDSISHLLQERGGTVVRPERFVPPGRAPLSRPAQRFIDDIELLSNFMMRTYAAYEYLGGDEVFLPVFAQLVEALESQEYWYVEDFVALVSDSFGEVINDNHFNFGGRIVGGCFEQVHMFGNDYDFFIPAYFDDVFDKTENGFRNRRTGAYVRELHFDGEPLCFETEDIFRLKMCNNGMFYYSIVIVRPRSEENTFPVTIVYDNRRSDNITATSLFVDFMDFENVSLQYIHEVPVITIRIMGFLHDPVFGPYSTKFLNLADDVRDEPVVIVDVRSNMGGLPLLPMMWLYNFLGEVVPTNYIAITHMNTDMEHITHQTWIYSAFTCTFSAAERIGDYHVLSFATPRRIVPNEQLIILLTDRLSASASESFTDALFNVENTLIIGQNTMGALLTDGMSIPIFLPNSGATFAFGRSLNVLPYGHAPEGIGIAPDIWVNDDALEATLAMLGASSFGGGNYD